MATQLQRSTQTQQQLLAATERLLAEQGYAAVSEARICDLANLTRGALRHHYPNGRYDLLPVLLEKLIAKQSEKIEAAQPQNPRERVYLMLFGLLEASIQPETVAILEVWMAARGDAKLAERINPIMNSSIERLFGMTPDTPIDPDLLALRCLLHGACMHCYSVDYRHEELVRAIQWVLERLPPPAGFVERLSAAQAA
ncbi:transcriptional regulator, TetR family [Andreprevotia lacus DSM 23236]|jgi:AcrR family transcriptional regulator|uniref:Transcriptional regulator, TetR family n=1 Tax=Andreprevotia lacus DSM 23236 TaxID=1121001 RepID=A0A1W1WWR1_9NEIS|nr:TetR/AcrR family transcriptional regulator [Andreprevotia lacus]SMC16162.1 transcriptional regulator, TetR family [Andreprevotia lacus DSM 23236]